MGVIIFVAFFLGDYLDKKFNTKDVYTITLSLSAIFFSLAYVFKKINKT